MVKGTLQSNLIFAATVAVLWLVAGGYCKNKMDEDYLLHSNEKNIQFKNLNSLHEVFQYVFINNFFGSDNLLDSNNLLGANTRKVDSSISDDIVMVQQSNIQCLDFDAQMNSIYYSNDHKEIFTKNPFTNYSEKIIYSMPNAGYLKSFAFDWVAKNIYFIDGKKDSLSVLKIDILNSKHKNSLEPKVIMELLGLREIVVHPNKGYIFVIASLQIYRADMNGINLINMEWMVFEWPKSLALDFDMNRLYWCDPVYYKVYHSNLDLKDVKIIQLESKKIPWLLVIYKEWMYISSMHMNKIYILNKLNGAKTKEILIVHSLTSMKIYSKYMQRIDNTNPCSEGGNCDKLCLAIQNVNKSKCSTSLCALCSCTEGETIDLDGKTCIDDWNALYVFIWSCASISLIFLILIYFIFNFI